MRTSSRPDPRPEPRSAARSTGPSTWRPALRIARREVLRTKGRSALVAVMVGLPVALVTCLASISATNAVSPVESIPTRLGATAAELMPDDSVPVYQDPVADNRGQVPRATPTDTGSAGDGDGDVSDGGAAAPLDGAGLARLTGGTVIDLQQSSTLIRTERGRLSAFVLSADLTRPQLTGIVVLRSGHLPTADDQVLVSPGLADRGYPVGATVALADGATPATVVGVAQMPYGMWSDQQVFARPGLGLTDTDEATHRYLLDRAAPVTWAEVLRLNQAGVTVFSRAVVSDPPAGWRADLPPDVIVEGGSDGAMQAVLVLIIFSIVLEVVLLAGPAFAVGVRRQARQLALLAAAGGSGRDVRRVVLAQAMTLGVAASAVGAALGLGAAGLFVWLLPRVSTVILGPWQVDWRSTAAAVALGSVAALVAAWAPSRTASRIDVVAVLAGRRGQTRSHRGWPVLGAVLVAAGAVVALTVGTRPGGEFGVAAGTLVMVLGAITAMPAVIGLLGSLGSHLPLPLRLATRDSARQRGRTAPAVAAVMAAVAGVTTLAIGATSDSAQNRLEYQPRQAAGVTTVQSYETDANVWTTIDSTVRSQTGRSTLPYGELGRRDGPKGYTVQTQVYVRLPGCPDVPSTDEAAEWDRCDHWRVGGSNPTGSWTSRGPLVADTAALTELGYPLTAAQRRTLDEGGVLVPAPELIVDGAATVTTYSTSDDGSRLLDVVTRTLPAAHLSLPPGTGPTDLIELVLTPTTAKALDLPWIRTGGVLTPPSNQPSGAETAALTTSAQNRLTETLAGISPYVEVYTERGFVDDLRLPLLVLTAVGGLAVLVGTLTATGLALTESRPDLATLAAVGARPRTRRVMAAAQALVIGLLGAVAGLMVGLVPGIAVTWPLTSTRWSEAVDEAAAHGPTIAIPWLMLLGMGVAVPVIAALAAGLGVRSRLPLTRRLGQ